MKIMQNLNLWKKIFLVGMMPVMIISVVIGTSSYRRTKEEAYNLTKNAVSDQVKRIDLSLNTRVSQIEISLKSLAEILGAEYDIPESGIDTTDRMISYMDNLRAPFSEIRAVVIAWDDGTLYTSDENRELNMGQLAAIMRQAGENPDRAIWTHGDISLFNNTESILVYKCLSDKAGDHTGVVVAEISYRLLGINMLSQQRIQQSQTTFLLNERKDLIYSDNYLPDQVKQEIVKSYLQGSRRTMIEVDGDSFYAYMLYSGTTGWVIASFVPEKELFTSAQKLQKYITTLLACGILIAGVFLFILTQRLLRPLEELKRGMETVQNTGFDKPVYVESQGTDEIGQLTESFNYMIKALHESINRIYKEELLRQNAEMEALTAQINPHFLYNTLDSINWVLIDRGEYDISDLLIALGKLMQYSMHTSISVVTLKDEYNNISDYLVLQKNRLEDKLTYHLELDPAIEDLKLPKLVLQPLVENAIIHGVLASKRAGTLWVQSSRAEKGVCITIKDNGAGMTEEKLRQFRMLCSGDAAEKKIGVQNVAKRLRLHFGEDVVFLVESDFGKGTCLQIIVPEEKGDIS